MMLWCGIWWFVAKRLVWSWKVASQVARSGAQRQRGRLSRTVQSRTAEKGKVNRWEGEAVEQASIQ
jgi:hypothetical protein